MSPMASQITSLTIVYSTVYSGADQRKHQSSASLVFVRGIHWWQRASNAENVSIWWRHNDNIHILRPSYIYYPLCCSGYRWFWLTFCQVTIVFTRSIRTRYDICWLIRAYTTHQMEHFSYYLPLVRETTGHWWIPLTRPVTPSFVFSLIYYWTKGWVNNRYADDLRRNRAHYDVTVMLLRAYTTHQREHFPRYLPFVRGIPITGGFHSKDQWRGAF